MLVLRDANIGIVEDGIHRPFTPADALLPPADGGRNPTILSPANGGRNPNVLSPPDGGWGPLMLFPAKGCNAARCRFTTDRWIHDHSPVPPMHPFLVGEPPLYALKPL